jgi:hypothetical protein
LGSLSRTNYWLNPLYECNDFVENVKRFLDKMVMPHSLGNRPGGNFQNAENVREFCLIPDNNPALRGVIDPHISKALLKT